MSNFNPLQVFSIDKIPLDYSGMVIFPNGSEIYFHCGQKIDHINFKINEMPTKDFTGVGVYPNSYRWFVNGKLHRENNPAIEKFNGDKCWYEKGQRHRIGGPAIEFKDGTKEWYENGLFHRLDGPAVDRPDGRKSWYINGKKYSEIDYNEAISKLKEKEMTIEKVLAIKNLKEIPTDYSGWVILPSTEKLYYVNGKKINYLYLPENEDEPYNFTGIIFYSNDLKYWFKKGKVHRDDGPAIEHSNGTKEWYLNGNLHRLDGPAIECYNGSNWWYIENVSYSEENYNKKIDEIKGKETNQILKIVSAQEIPENYTGIVECENGTKQWRQNGEFHRIDGPAVENANGTKEWFIENVGYPEKVFNEKIQEMNQPNKMKTGFLKIDDPIKCYSNKTDKFDKVKSIVKHDSKLVAQRVAAKKVIDVFSSFLTTRFSGTHVSKNTLISFFESDSGKAILGLMIGFSAETMNSKIPEKYRNIFNNMSQEFRVEAMSHFTEKLSDFVTNGVYDLAKGELIKILSEFQETEQIRIDLANDNKINDKQIPSQDYNPIDSDRSFVPLSLAKVS